MTEKDEDVSSICWIVPPIDMNPTLLTRLKRMVINRTLRSTTAKKGETFGPGFDAQVQELHWFDIMKSKKEKGTETSRHSKWKTPFDQDIFNFLSSRLIAQIG